MTKEYTNKGSIDNNNNYRQGTSLNFAYTHKSLLKNIGQTFSIIVPNAPFLV